MALDALALKQFGHLQLLILPAESDVQYLNCQEAHAMVSIKLIRVLVRLGNDACPLRNDCFSLENQLTYPLFFEQNAQRTVLSFGNPNNYHELAVIFVVLVRLQYGETYLLKHRS